MGCSFCQAGISVAEESELLRRPGMTEGKNLARKEKREMKGGGGGENIGDRSVLRQDKGRGRGGGDGEGRKRSCEWDEKDVSARRMVRKASLISH